MFIGCHTWELPVTKRPLRLCIKAVGTGKEGTKTLDSNAKKIAYKLLAKGKNNIQNITKFMQRSATNKS